MPLPRPTRKRTATLLCGVLASLLLALSTQSPAADAQPLLTGVTNLGSGYQPLAYQRTKAAGASLVRLQLHWEELVPETAPTSWNPEDPADPNYRWDRSDEAVIQAVQAGLTPVFQLGGTPHWTQRCQVPSGIPPFSLCDPDPAALKSFAIAAARRYSGNVPGIPRVTHWQVLNEPNLSLFFYPQYDAAGRLHSPDLYRDLVNAVDAGVKSVDPANLVVAGGLGPIAVPPWTIGPMRFARQLLCMQGHNHPKPTRGDCGGGVHFDIFAMQPYSTGGPAHEGQVNDVQIGDLGKLETLLDAADKAGRIKGRFKHTPLWVTEFSWDSAPPDPGGLPMSTLTRWTAEALHGAWRAGVSHFFWYSLHDSEPDPSRPFNQTLESGLYFRGPTLEQDQPKPVLQAFRFPFVAYPRKDRRLDFWGRTPSSGPGKVAIQLWQGGRWRTTTTIHADRWGIFRGVVPSGYGSDGQGMARAVHGNQTSPSFAMRGIAEFRHPPFG